MGILMYNSLIILAKQFIHTCRFRKVRPLFLFFLTLNNKALKYKTRQALEVFKIMHNLITH